MTARMKVRHLSGGHPLAGVARRRCAELHNRSGGLVGGVACGECWEVAIRADALMACAFELPEETPAADPAYLDPIAIQRAAAGERVRLSRGERAEVAWRIVRGELPWSLAERIGLSRRSVSQLAVAAAEAVGPEVAA